MARSATPPSDTPGRPLTGFKVLMCFIGFFGVIFAVNAYMVRAAVVSFGGVETESSYKAGLAFKQESDAAIAQAARHWKVEALLVPGRLDVTARDAQGQPLTGLDLTVALHHPTDRRYDEALEATSIGAGQWRATPAEAPGQWDLVIELARNGERLFRSTNRIITK
ncbi:MAG TPA: FixH family protein [Ancylobacter sp.]